jgi:coproporphyrinogen III oxidase-like Fe-S oxidoreductase
MSWFNDILGLSPTKVSNVDTSEYSQLGKEFFDPNSMRNRGMYNNLKNMGIDSAAQQYLSGMKMQAAGQNPFANQQYRSNLAQGTEQTHNAYNQYMQQAQGIGSGLFGYALQGQMQNANAVNMARLAAQQNAANFLQGLFAAGSQAAPQALFGG